MAVKNSRYVELEAAVKGKVDNVHTVMKIGRDWHTGHSLHLYIATYMSTPTLYKYWLPKYHVTMTYPKDDVESEENEFETRVAREGAAALAKSSAIAVTPSTTLSSAETTSKPHCVINDEELNPKMRWHVHSPTVKMHLYHNLHAIVSVKTALYK